MRDNGYRHYVCEYVLDRWIPVSMHDTYEDAYVNVTRDCKKAGIDYINAEHHAIAYLDKMLTKCNRMYAEQKILRGTEDRR